MAPPRPPLSPKSSSSTSVGKRVSGLWRPRSISNMLSNMAGGNSSTAKETATVAPASVPLPLSPTSQVASLPSSPSLLTTRPLFHDEEDSTSNALSPSTPHSSRGMPNNGAPFVDHVYDAASDPSLRYSLALLEGALEELGGLSSPRLSRVDGEPELAWVGEEAHEVGSESEGEEEELEIGDIEIDPREREYRERAGSLGQYQLPPSPSSQEEFGQNMLWDALGLDPELEDDSSLPYSRSHTSGIPSIDSIPSIKPTRQLSNQTASSEEFDISDFPSYSDLATFANGSDGSPQIKDNRSSDLLEFPIPPSEISPTRSDFKTEHVAAPVSFAAVEPTPQSDFSAEEAQVFERLAQLGNFDNTGAQGSAVQGLGLFDSSVPSPRLAPSEYSSRERTSEDSNDFRSEHSSSCTTASHSTRTTSSANTSFNLSKDEIATYHQAASIPHRFSGLPSARPTEAPPSLPHTSGSSGLLPSDLSTTPPLVAVASLQSLPEIFRTHPSPEAVTVPLGPAPAFLPPPRHHSIQAQRPGLGSPLTLDTTSFISTSTRSNSPVDYSPPPVSPGIVVASMQRPLDSPTRTSSFEHSFNGGESSRLSSPTSSRPSSRQGGRSRDPAEMHMVSTDSLGLEGDNGMPLWTPSPVEESSSPTREEPPTPRSKQGRASSPSPQQQQATKSASSAPRSPLAGPPVTVHLNNSPPPVSTKPLQSMSRRLSFLTLRKRKSEMTLSTFASSTKPAPSPLIIPAAPHKLARRSVSTPRLSSAFKASSSAPAHPPLPTSPTLSSFAPPSRPFSMARRGSTGEQQDGATATKSRKNRFSAFFTGAGGGAKGKEAAEIVPPVPSLPPPAPMSAPPTTTTFSFASMHQTAQDSDTAPSFDEGGFDTGNSSPSTVGFPPTPVSAAPVSTPGFFDFAPTARAPMAWREGTPTSFYSSTAGDGERDSGSSTPMLAGMTAPRFYDEEDADGEEEPYSRNEAEEVERLSLAAFIKSAVPVPEPSQKEDGGERVVPRPVRSSSFFSMSHTIFPSSSRPATPLGEVTNRSATTGGKRAHSPMPFAAVKKQEQFVVPDIMAFPMTTSPRMMNVQVREDSVEVEEEESGSEHDDDEDDKPLGVIPGALKMQKSLRQESRKAKKGPSSSSKQVDPFALDDLLKRNPSTSARTPSPGEAVGHSLLPQTDDAVERRSAALTRSPSSPLDPLVANSSLTIDSPELAKKPLRPVAATRSATLPLASTSSSREPSPRRPSLGVQTSSPSLSPSLPASSSLAPPRPTGRLPPTPTASAPPSRRPSQSHDHAIAQMQRQRSNTSSSSGHPRTTTTDMQRTLSKSSTSASPRLPSPASPALATVEHRIFIGDHTKRIVFPVTSLTQAVEVVAFAKAKGALEEGDEKDGGWCLWEICRTLGVERPIREYELVNDVVKSWDHDSNILIIRRTTLWPLLSSHLRPHPPVPRGAFVQLEVKKGKWSKRYLELKDGVVSHAKSEKGKDSTTLCQLASFEVFFVASHVVDQLKAPKPFVFALKSRLPRAHYENESEYCFFLSVKTAEELQTWVKALIEARNVFARQQASTTPGATSSTSSSPSLNSAAAFSRPTGTGSPSLSRAPTLRPAPAILAIPSSSLPSSSGGLKSPIAGVMAKPEARVWAALDEGGRQAWLKEAQREAREQGKTLLDLQGEAGRR